jgi:hypothetical protein
MTDLHTLMARAASPAPAPTAPLLAAIAKEDLARGRIALRRRRIGRIGASSGLFAVAALGAFAFAAPGVLPGFATTPTISATGIDTGSGASESSVGGTALVSYAGKQPVGYILDKVPVGWEIVSADAGGLLLAPEGSTDKESEEGLQSFVGKIAVMQEGESSFPSGIPMDDVMVGKRPGVIAHMEGGGDTRTLFVKQPSGNYLAIQVWSGLGWDNNRIVEFATGVHITKDATVTLG